MCKRNSIFIAQSIDGYISNRDGGLEWLNKIYNPENIDMGYQKFMMEIDAVVMGRKTFQTVCSFDIEWPYEKHVFVLSKTLKFVTDNLKGKAEIISGEPSEITKILNNNGFKKLYIDGGTTIQHFLNVDLIDEMIITTIPVLLGGGMRLFNKNHVELNFSHVKTELFLNEIVQNHYIRSR